MAKRFLVALVSPLAAAGCHSDGPRLPTAAPKTVTMVASGGFSSPTDAVASPDGRDFYFAAFDAMNTPTVFRTSSQPGGSLDVISAGDPLDLPIGLVMACDGQTVYVAHMGGGAAPEVIWNLGMVPPGGVSLTAGGGTAVMPTRDDAGHAQLTSVEISTGEMHQLSTPNIQDPAGLRTARSAGVFAVVDSEGGAIFRAE